MATHEYTIRLQTSASHVQIACDGTYLALPLARTTVAIWSLVDISCRPLELEGHSKKITALRFSHSAHSTLLCSGGDDYIIVWNVEKVRASYSSGQQVRGKVIATTLGAVQSLSFSPSNHVVAACVGREVYILDATHERIDTILEGHDSTVNCAEFCPHYTSTLVSGADDRTFKVWDISEGCMLYQSTIISSSPFISLTMSPIHESFAIGTADGQVRVYDLTDGNGFRCLHHLDVEKLNGQMKDVSSHTLMSTNAPPIGPKTISSRPTWQKMDTGRMGGDEGNEDTGDAECEVGSSVLSMCYVSYMSSDSRTPTPAKLSFLNQSNSVVGDVLKSAPVLIIGTTGAINLVNAKTLEPCGYVSLMDPIPSSSMLEDTHRTVSLTGNIIVARSVDTDQVWIIAGGLFHNEVNVVKLNLPTSQEISSFRKGFASRSTCVSAPEREAHSSSTNSTAISSDDLAHLNTNITVLSSTPLLPNSPLKSELVLKKKTKPVKKSQGSRLSTPPKYGALSKKGQIHGDKPITFHPSVRSSGYSKETPKVTLFQPRISPSPNTQWTNLKLKKSSATEKEYPLDSKAPTVMKVKIDATDRPTAINSIKFSENGQNVVCALGNSSAQVFKMPLSGKGCAFAGHSGVVSSARWSRDSSWLITSSEDKTAQVWSVGLSDPVMTIATEVHNFGADKEGGAKPDNENRQFNRSVKFAQFYYMDRFILLTSGNSFNLYKYHLDLAKSDIKRYLSNNRYKMVKSLMMENSQQITAFSAVNGFHSYIALCAGTNKTVEVFDMNAAQSVRVIPDAHSRQIHCLCQNQGSPYVTHSGSAYDLFVTAAASDCIKLWDLRTNRCVCRYEGHCNRTQPCGLAFSPCSRYIATGSEDRCAYIFDIRTGTYLHKLTGHTDTVSDVEFHPLYPQLLTATLDGKLRLFVEP